MLEFENVDQGLFTACAMIPIIDDLLGNEPDELFSVTFSSFSPIGLEGDVAEACVTIVDNDGKWFEWNGKSVCSPLANL